MYSPFKNEHGIPKSIYQIEYDDLYTLKENNIDEGLFLEYKSELSESVLNKIPGICSSFSNESGGWIIIGIDNKTKDLIPFPEGDHHDVINNKVNGNCSPKIDLIQRFLKKDPSDNEGIHVVFIPEGADPPYFFSGKMYRRIGSSSHKQKEVDRSDLDHLFTKAIQKKKRMKKFCKRKINIENYRFSHNTQKWISYGICNIYLMPKMELSLLEKTDPYAFAEDFIKFSQQMHHYDSMVGKKNGNDLTMSGNTKFEHFNFTPGSIVFRSNRDSNGFENCVGWEMFYDGRSRIHIPLNYLSKDKMAALPEQFRTDSFIDDFPVIDGDLLLITSLLAILQYLKFMQEKAGYLPEITHAFELENINKNVLYIGTKKYTDYVLKNGIMFSDRDRHFINRTFQQTIIKEDLWLVLILIAQISAAFGIDGTSAVSILLEKMRNDQG